MSQADPGRMERMSVGARLITDVCAIADRPFVEAVENNFAGYFDELGITVKFRAEASDADVISLQNELLAFLDAPDAARPAGFTWLIHFSRGGHNLRSLFPGDAPRSGSDDLTLIE